MLLFELGSFPDGAAVVAAGLPSEKHWSDRLLLLLPRPVLLTFLFLLLALCP